MEAEIKEYLREIESFNESAPEKVEQFRIKFLGRKGIIPALFEDFKESSQRRQA
ncbi:MAG: hypothetical protein U5L96_01900 [Owenweeksia sp.]|nr:hypothetical protein [Owenweeksia sp.]